MIVAGLLYDPPTGRVHVRAATPTIFANGGGFLASGFLTITFDPVDGDSVENGGFAFTPDGRLHVTFTSTPDDEFIQGVRVSEDGAVVLSGS